MCPVYTQARRSPQAQTQSYRWRTPHLQQQRQRQERQRAARSVCASTRQPSQARTSDLWGQTLSELRMRACVYAARFVSGQATSAFDSCTPLPGQQMTTHVHVLATLFLLSCWSVQLLFLCV